MKKRFQQSLLLLFALLLMPLGAWADREVNQLKFGKQIIEVFAGEAPHEGPATMEDLELADESYWNGSDGKGSFISGGYRFENGYELSDYGAYAYGFF